MQIALARQPVDAAVDPFEDVAALAAVEEVVDEEPDLARGHHAGADRTPPVREREARHLLGLEAVTEAARRLGRGEVDVPALLLYDAAHELAPGRGGPPLREP